MSGHIGSGPSRKCCALWRGACRTWRAWTCDRNQKPTTDEHGLNGLKFSLSYFSDPCESVILCLSVVSRCFLRASVPPCLRGRFSLCRPSLTTLPPFVSV